MNQHQLHTLQAMMVFMPIIILVFIVMAVIPYWMIWKKAGFSPWFGLLMIIPMVSMIMLYVLAFSEWKVTPVAKVAPGYYPPPTSLPPQA